MTLLDGFKEYVSPVLGRYFEDLEIVSGKGCNLYDMNGKEYLDFSSGIATCSTGHCHPKVVRAAVEQTKKLIHICIGVALYEPYIKLGEELRKILPITDSQIFCCQSGSEAVEAAIKLAKYAAKKQGIIAFQGAFHGRTLGALSVTTSKIKYREGYEPLLPEVYISAFDLNAVEEIMKNHQIGGVIIEPILGEGGYIVVEKQFMKGLRALCNKYNCLLIFDEVQTGIGRTGHWFAANYFEVAPDIMALAKGIASGFPLGVCAAKKEIMAKWTPGAHGSTFGGNPVSCAAAIATLTVIQEKGLVAKADKLGKYIIKRLKAMQKSYSRIKEVRGMGLMIGVDFQDNEIVKKILNICLREGLILISTGGDGTVIRFIPPLIIKKDEIDHALFIFEKALGEIL
ncbi:aminotransferase class III-fold pyridoxal phosphate-dependent enzyme [Candidatus Saganbacteria bacterium]|nr:aminotransferase class III-fold pyridoxal phosphate-dependent enzyme [Candidatus Saganbacteria bacterium]